MKKLRVETIGAWFVARTKAGTICRYLDNAELIATGGASRAPALAAGRTVRCGPSGQALAAARNIDDVSISTPHRFPSVTREDARPAMAVAEVAYESVLEVNTVPVKNRAALVP